MSGSKSKRGEKKRSSEEPCYLSLGAPKLCMYHWGPITDPISECNDRIIHVLVHTSLGTSTCAVLYSTTSTVAVRVTE
jgi:hypothetical protein